MGKSKLPKGIYYLSDRNTYKAQFMIQGKRYCIMNPDLEILKSQVENRKAEIKLGLYKTQSDITFSSWFETWIAEYKSDLKQGTVATYKQVYKNYLSDEFGKRKLKDITPLMIQSLINGLATKGLSCGRIHIVYIVLNQMFKRAKLLKVINDNPMSDNAVTMPSKKAIKPREYKSGNKVKAMTASQKELFLKHSKGSVYYDSYVFMLSTGCRLGEMMGLQWDDVDLKNRKLYIRHTLTYIRGKGRYLDKPKTESSIRTIPMTNTLYSVLKDVRTKQAKQKNKYGSSWKSEKDLENTVFTYPEGGAFWEAGIRVNINGICSEIQKENKDFERITPHSFRHTFATLGIRNGIPPKTMQKLLGHSSLKTTMDTYVSVQDEDFESSMNIIQAII